jgi:hypothetical protein
MDGYELLSHHDTFNSKSYDLMIFLLVLLYQ